MRDNTPTGEARYRARCYFDPNAVTMSESQDHDLLAGRTGSAPAFRIQLKFDNGGYTVQAEIRTDAGTDIASGKYAITDAPHFIEVDWAAATAAGANDGYLSLWIDGELQETTSGIDNDTLRIEQARLGAPGSLNVGIAGTEYFDAFESRRQTYIGPVGVFADFSANPLQGAAPLTVTFTNASQPTATITSYLWNFGDGYTSTITNPVHTYTTNGTFTVALTASDGVAQDTLTKTQYITVSDFLFADGFEAGNLSAWSSAVTNTGRLTVSAAAALVGSYGLSATIVNTTSMYVNDDTPASEPRYRVRFYFDPNSITMADGDNHDLFAARSAVDNVFKVLFRRSGGAYQVNARLRNDAGGEVLGAWYSISDAAHFLELDWQAATASGANNGYLSLWIDGALQETVAGVDNDTLRVEQARLGPLAGLDAGTSGTEYFDAFESRRQTYIGPVGGGGGATTTTITYTYDPLYRLTGATYSGAYTYTFGYAYDAVGNRTVQTRTITSTLVTTYTYDEADRLTSVNGQTYTWDNNGNLLNDGNRTYTYDHANRLMSISGPGLTWSAVYNGDGVRLKQIANGTVTTYTLDYAAGNRILVEATAQGTTVYLYGYECLGEYSNNAWLYYLNTADGYVRQTTDTGAQLVSAWVYSPDGLVLVGPQGTVSHLVCGGVYDWATGLIYRDGRYFDPTLGIWLGLVPLVVIQWLSACKKKRRNLQPHTLLLLAVYIGCALAACNPVPQPEELSPCGDAPKLQRLQVVLQAPRITQDALGPRRNPDELYVELGHPTPQEAVGALVTGEVRTPSDPTNAGVLEFVQNVSSEIEYEFEDEIWGFPSASPYLLDGGDPYNPGRECLDEGQPCVHTLEDSPANTLSITSSTRKSLIRLKRHDRFRTYLMWRPLFLGGERVPLGVVEWEWSVVVERNASGTFDRIQSSPQAGEVREGTEDCGMPETGPLTIQDWVPQNMRLLDIKPSPTL